MATIEERVTALEMHKEVVDRHMLLTSTKALSSLNQIITEQVGALRQEMIMRFAAVDARFDAVDARFAAVDARFDAMDARFDAMEKQHAEFRAETGDRLDRIEELLGRLLEGQGK